MKILILTQWFPPEPGLLMPELAQTLMALGHQVTVLTGFQTFLPASSIPAIACGFCKRRQSRVFRLYESHSIQNTAGQGSNVPSTTFLSLSPLRC